MNRFQRYPGRIFGFSLVELLVVIAIIALLLALLIPTLAKAQMQAKSVNCRSNLRQNYGFLIMYAQDNHGILFPTGRGDDLPPEKRWPCFVFKPSRWDPPTMKCPSDPDGRAEHSYILNLYVDKYGIRFGRGTTRRSITEIVLMGEKRTGRSDYYLAPGEFDAVVELHRHGLSGRSNYLYLDGHVQGTVPELAVGTTQPWDPGGSP